MTYPRHPGKTRNTPNCTSVYSQSMAILSSIYVMHAFCEPSEMWIHFVHYLKSVKYRIQTSQLNNQIRDLIFLSGCAMNLITKSSPLQFKLNYQLYEVKHANKHVKKMFYSNLSKGR